MRNTELLVNLSREFHELDSAIRLAQARSVPVLGAVAVDFINAYSLKLCMDKELPAIIGELGGMTELGEARNAIRDGRRFVSRSLLREEGYRYVDYPTGLSLLSEQESLCVDAKLGGLSCKEASALLGLEPSTVNTYTSRAYGKLGVSSGEELVWLFAGRPMGCYHEAGPGKKPRLFPVSSLQPREDKKKPEQALACSGARWVRLCLRLRSKLRRSGKLSFSRFLKDSAGPPFPWRGGDGFSGFHTVLSVGFIPSICRLYIPYLPLSSGIV